MCSKLDPHEYPWQEEEEEEEGLFKANAVNEEEAAHLYGAQFCAPSVRHPCPPTAPPSPRIPAPTPHALSMRYSMRYIATTASPTATFPGPSTVAYQPRLQTDACLYVCLHVCLYVCKCV